MSKIICDVCGTRYPESAEQCPICGKIRATGGKTAADSFVMDEAQPQSQAYVRGGRFSKSNVRKRNQNLSRYEADEKKGKSMPTQTMEEYEENEPNKGSNTILNILLVIVIVALLAVSGYIFKEYILPNVLTEETAPSTEAVTEEPTEPTETEEPTIPCTSLDLSDTVVLLEEEGQFWLLNVAVLPEDTTDEVVYTSSDETVATVNAEGRITAVGQGDTVITVTCGDQMLECAVVCSFDIDETEPEETQPEETTAPTEPLKDVTLSVKNTDVTFKVKGQQATFKLTCDLENTEVQWISEDESIVTVDENGIATAVGKGTTNVIVKYGEQEVTIIVRCRLG